MVCRVDSTRWTWASNPMHRDLGESDHCAAPGAAPVHPLQAAARHSEGCLLKEGFTEADLTRG